MNDKRKQIIEAAMRCFSRKGYQATSIQEIADELGMAKGSLYFYFKSKDELLLSVFAQFIERMLAGLSELPQERQLPAKERLRLQLQRSFESIVQNREFPLMLTQTSLEGNPAMKSIIMDIRSRLLRWCYSHIETIYGPGSNPYSWDGVALLNGMMSEYARVLVVGRSSFDADRLSRFFVNRLDDLMEGLIRESGPPLMGFENLMDGFECVGEKGAPSDSVFDLLRALRRKAEEDGKNGMSQERYEDVLASLSRLEEELAKPIPDRITVRGLLAYLKEIASPSWLEQMEPLEKRIFGH